MSAFRALAARRSPVLSYGIVQRAGFHSSIARAAGKEDKLHTEGRADEAESLKQDQLKKQKEGSNHWEEGLASNSESALKADRGEPKDTKQHIKDLQEESAKLASTKSK